MHQDTLFLKNRITTSRNGYKFSCRKNSNGSNYRFFVRVMIMTLLLFTLNVDGFIDQHHEGESSSKTYGTTYDDNNSNNNDDNDDRSSSFLLLCLTDGSIYSVSAWTGDYHSTIKTSPLLQTSRAKSNDGRKSNNEIIIPGLDGRLYLANEQTNQLKELDLTIHSLLENPVRSCDPERPDVDCGILTAEAETSLLALTATGQLLWKTNNEQQDDDNGDDDNLASSDLRAVSNPPLFLQRKDYRVQHVLASSGQQSWNLSLGMYHALDFEPEEFESTGIDDDGQDDDDDDDDEDDDLDEIVNDYLRSQRNEGNERIPHKVRRVEKKRKQQLYLPAVRFANSGRTLTAVHPETGVILWRHSVPSVVSVVFGIHNGQWKIPEVLDYSDIYNNSDQYKHSNTETDYANVSVMNPKDSVGVTLDPMARSFGKDYQRLLWESYYLSQRLPTTKNHLLELPSRASNSIHKSDPEHDKIQHLPKPHIPWRKPFTAVLSDNNNWCPAITLPKAPKVRVQSQPEGLLLSWSLVAILTLTIFTIGSAIFFWIRVRKFKVIADGTLQCSPIEKSDMYGQTKARSATITSGTMIESLDTISQGATLVNQKKFRRTLSLPGTWGLFDNNASNANQYREKTVLNNSDANAINATHRDISVADLDGHAFRSPQAAPLERTLSTVGGIPLVQYSRYASEFNEMKPMGKGGFGTVFCCKNVLDGRDYAIKKVVIVGALKPKPGEEKSLIFEHQLQRVLREVKILAVLDHPNIVRYYTAWLELKSGDDNEGIFDRGGNRDFSSMPSSQCYSSSHLVTTDSVNQWETSKREHNCRSAITLDPNLGWENTGFEMDTSSTTSEQFSANLISPHRSRRLGRAMDDYLVFEDTNEEDESSSCQNDQETSPVPAVSQTGSAAFIAGIDNGSVETSGIASLKSEAVFRTLPRGNDTFRHQSTGTASDSTGRSVLVETRGDASEVTNLPHPHQNNDDSKSTSLIRHTLYIQMELCSQKTVADFLMEPSLRGDYRPLLSSTSTGANTELSNGSIDIPKALRLFSQIAEAVKHVHCQGLIHRDLKPSNCFLSEPVGSSTTVKVGDFGLSRQEQTSCLIDKKPEESNPIDRIISPTCSDDSMDDQTAGVGTRLYASPEQMNGSDYDTSTDVYSLGIMLFELLYPMYTGMERNICISKLRDSLIFPKDWHITVGNAFPDLDDMIRQMVRRDPSARPSAESVARHVGSVLGQFTVLSLDQNHDDDPDIFLLRVEASHREDTLGHTIRLLHEITKTIDTGAIHDLTIVQYGLRSGSSGNTKQQQAAAIMEFALKLNVARSIIGSSTQQNAEDHNHLWKKSVVVTLLIAKLSEQDGIFKVRQISSAASLSYSS